MAGSTSTSTLRKVVAFSFILSYILLGLPLWYKLTTVYRAPLPAEYIESLHNNQFQDVHLVIPVYIKPDVYQFPDIHDAVQVQVNHLLDSMRQTIPWSLQILPYDEKVMDENNEHHIVNLQLSDFVGYNSAFDSKETTVFYDDQSVVSNDLPFFIAQTLVEHTFQLEASKLSGPLSNNDDSITVGYHPNIHLSISLLNGDGTPVGWDIDSSLKDYFTPFRKLLSPIVNFTVDSSVLYYNDLNLHLLNSVENITAVDLSHSIDLSELSSMNYFEESTALNLAIVFPNSETSSSSGLEFIKSTEPSKNWQSFLVPQWGVIVINKYPLPSNAFLTESYLSPIMYQFAQDLFKLMDLTDSNSDEMLSPYVRIDSFKRITTLSNLQKATETLWSLIKLTKSFEQMAVPSDVMTNVTKALSLRLQIIELLNNPEKGGDLVWNEALSLSNTLVSLCETAFFHGEMVQQNFFPQEHKVAVYLPLIGPLTVVTLLGFINIMKEKKVLAKIKNQEKEKEEEDVKKVD
ncbi:hypothetical protein NCAS_0F01160 [Naumovozyma castellii]|uniref:GPI transamidase component GPI17 n=1 Tax=Naumovozyma castellii TaxID=27288 RepID=G0VGH9_NAUCA|nr:hypothetical protein NCAS_0F01160 [Naumovozyma castellii CBS 4309]CCC70600.1 hypothetical protein NCAS_0F01160 [Naumovozyma castellii CBS 4309]